MRRSLSIQGWLRPFVTVAVFASIGIALSADAYVLEGQSWPAGAIVELQLSLGDPGRTLQDGTTSWDAAAAPAAMMWNEKMQRAHFTQVFNSSVSASSTDHLNSVVFANTIFGQPFGANTVAVTYY